MRIDLHDGFYLSPVRDGDEAAYVEHFRDKDTTDRLVKIPYPYTDKDAEFWVRFCVDAENKNNRPNHFAIRRADGFLVGGIGLQLGAVTSAHRAELGYWLAKDYRGRGLASASVSEVVRFAFEKFGLRRVEATAAIHNVPSHRVLEKAGFTREGFLAHYHIKNGELIDVYLFSILESGTASPA
jgi:ribosomal-protein-alanine N-acetyltransferase